MTAESFQGDGDAANAAHAALASYVETDARTLDALSNALKAQGQPADLIREEANAAWSIANVLRKGKQ